MNITQRRFNHLTIFFTLCFLVVGPLTFAQALKQHDEFEKLFTHIQQSCSSSVQSKLAQITSKKRQLFERLEKLKLHADQLSSEELVTLQKISNLFRRLRYRVGCALKSHSGNSKILLEEVSAIFRKFRQVFTSSLEEQISFDKQFIPDALAFMSHMINTVLNPANLSLSSSLFSWLASHKGELALAVSAALSTYAVYRKNSCLRLYEEIEATEQRLHYRYRDLALRSFVKSLNDDSDLRIYDCYDYSRRYNNHKSERYLSFLKEVGDLCDEFLNPFNLNETSLRREFHFLYMCLTEIEILGWLKQKEHIDSLSFETSAISEEDMAYIKELREQHLSVDDSSFHEDIELYIKALAREYAKGNPGGRDEAIEGSLRQKIRDCLLKLKQQRREISEKYKKYREIIMSLMKYQKEKLEEARPGDDCDICYESLRLKRFIALSCCKNKQMCSSCFYDTRDAEISSRGRNPLCPFCRQPIKVGGMTSRYDVKRMYKENPFE